MSVGPLSLTLLAPGLLGTPTPAGGSLPPANLPPGFPVASCPTLVKLLLRANTLSAPVESLRYRLCGYSLAANQDTPDAWLSYQVDSGSVAPGALLRADPVHLRADQQHLRLFDSELLKIDATEAQGLVAAFNQFFADDGLRLEAPIPQRWYLHLPAPADLHTTPLLQVIGRDIDAYLPVGPDARRWQQRLNELQMLFHDHPVNHAREARGQPLINSIWLWGGGRPLAPVAHAWQRIWSLDSTLSGLAHLNAIRCSPPPDDADSWLREVVGDRHLLSLDMFQAPVSYGDLDTWLALLEQAEQQWFAPLWQSLRSGRLKELLLHPGDGFAYHMTRGAQWRFWRRQNKVK